MKSEIAGTLVEWDENKNQQNIKKHGISFQTAALVFADEERIEYLDKLHSQDEERYVVLGCVQGILYVVYTIYCSPCFDQHIGKSQSNRKRLYRFSEPPAGQCNR